MVESFGFRKRDEIQLEKGDTKQVAESKGDGLTKGQTMVGMMY